MRMQALALVAGLMLSGAAGVASAQTPSAPASAPASAPPPGAAPNPPPPRFHEIVGRMSAPGQAIMAEAVSKSAQEQRRLQALKDTREHILTLIGAPQLDSEALAKAFERERILSQKVQASRQDSLLKAATQLSPADRQIFAESLRATRLHIPGETVRQMQQKAAENRKACAGDAPAAPARAAR